MYGRGLITEFPQRKQNVQGKKRVRFDLGALRRAMLLFLGFRRRLCVFEWLVEDGGLRQAAQGLCLLWLLGRRSADWYLHGPFDNRPVVT